MMEHKDPSINRYMDKQKAVYIDSRILLSHKEERGPDAWYNADEP